MSAVTQVVHPLRPLLLALAAVTIGLYGLRMMGLLGARGRFAWMQRTVDPVGRRPSRSDRPRAMLLGAIFGLTWTPCAGPILGGVLTYVAAREEHVVLGVPMLLAYAAGVATPLLLVAAASEYATPFFRRLGPHLATIERASGAALLGLAAVVLVQIPSGTTMTSPDPADGISDATPSGVARLLFFHSEHCPTCRAMNAYLPALERACGPDRWMLTKVDVDRPENASTVEGANVRAVPTVSLRDPHGREVLHLVGYQSQERLREALEHEAGASCANVDPEAPSEPTVDGATCEVGKAC